ncbi:MAG: hypothetical protein AAB437_02130 [Patescibacteria group bacterium]
MKKLMVSNIVIGIFLIVVSFFYTGTVLASQEFFVSPNGNASGNGSRENPWDLQTALNQPASVHPGDMIWLRGGTYTGNFISNLTGTAAAPITVKQYLREKAVFAASTGQFIFRASAPWGIYQGFEVVGTTPGRNTERPVGIQSYAANNKFINLIVHDANVGFQVRTGAVDSEIYGSIIYNNGYEDSVGWGSGIDLRSPNNDQGETYWFKDNIIFNQYEWGVKGYTGGEGIRGYNFEGNTIFNNSIFSFTQGGSECHPCNSCIPKTCYNSRGEEVSCCSGGGGPDWGRGSMIQNFVIGGLQIADRIVIKNNYFYAGLTNEEQGNAIQLGWWQYGENGSRGNRILLENNVSWFNSSSGYAIEQRWWNDITMKNNLFVSRQLFEDINGLGNFVSGTNNPPERLEQLQPNKFSGNKFQLSANEPNKIFVRPNLYEAGRANVTIYNWENKSQVDINLSSVLQPGDQFEIIDVQNYGAGTPFFTGTFSGNPVNITLPISTSSVTAPIGGTAPRHTSNQFSVLLIRRLSTGISTSPTPTNNPTCVCQTNNSCSADCVFEKIDGVSYSNLIKCNLSSSLFLVYPDSNHKTTWCNRQKKTRGDADGNGVVDLSDYFFYVASVFGGKIPPNVNPDFNGDGEVGRADLDILKLTLN